MRRVKSVSDPPLYFIQGLRGAPLGGFWHNSILGRLYYITPTAVAKDFLKLRDNKIYIPASGKKMWTIFRMQTWYFTILRSKRRELMNCSSVYKFSIGII